jgi:pimeloyl-ACP methyl ester carboxylesterase
VITDRAPCLVACGRHTPDVFSLDTWGSRLRTFSTPPIVDPEGRVVAGSIASVESVHLGGTDQWVSLRGRDIDNPLFVFVCGGPCASEMALVRHYNRALEDHFVVVMWDYRGAAKSFDAIRHAPPTLDRHVEDLRELIEWLTTRIGKRRVFVLGHSWGSVPALAFARKHGSLLDAYIGVGQIVDVEAGRRLAYDRTLELARIENDRAAIWLLERIGPPPYHGRWGRVAKHWALVQAALRQRGASSVKRVMREMAAVSWQAPEYSWVDRFNFVRALTVGMAEALPHTDGVDFTSLAPRLEVPAYFVMGRHDVLTPPDLVERYVAKLEAPRKRIIWFDRAAHLPPYEEPDRFVAAMVDDVLRDLA